MTRSITPDGWHGSEHTGKGFARLGDASNASRRHANARFNGRPGIGWSALYDYRMVGGRWYWRPRPDIKPACSCRLVADYGSAGRVYGGMDACPVHGFGE